MAHYPADSFMHPIFHFSFSLCFITSDHSFETKETLSKDFKQMQREPWHWLHVTIPEQFLLSFSVSIHLHKLQQGLLLAVLEMEKCLFSADCMQRLPFFRVKCCIRHVPYVIYEKSR
jgi:hypothetical protein